jgi:DNA-binding GntR family transcriptional regulator
MGSTQPSATATRSGSLTDRLRRDIVAGRLVPHQRLVEADVAEEHDASRGEVRLALNELVTEGLVERIPNRGARVRKVSVQEAIEITEVRAAVESLCARKAAEKITIEQAEQLQEIGALMSAAVEREARDEYSSLNRRLHTMIIDIADQQIAAQTIQRLRGQAIHHHFRLSSQPDRPRVSLPQHLEVIEALCARDPNRAAIAMQAHLESVTEAIAASSGI